VWKYTSDIEYDMQDVEMMVRPAGWEGLLGKTGG
jgi:hypothetical protein